MDLSPVLRAREARYNLIQKRLLTYPTIICIKANIPGPDKNIPISYWLVKMFSNQIKLRQEIHREVITSLDGIYTLIYVTDMDGLHLKSEMMALEDASPFGRLIDIDVFQQFQELHRPKRRKCIICDDDAVVCHRLNKHSQEELLEKTHAIFWNAFKTSLANLIDESMMLELNLEPKFGLVTPSSMGSHSDMDYNLMLSAKSVIIPYLVDIYSVSYSYQGETLELRNEIRKIGLEAEKKMLEVTHHVNAYKGLIFNLGFVLSSLALSMKSKSEFESIFDGLKALGEGLTEELNGEVDSFGKLAYQEVGLGGARKEMELGLTSVEKCMMKYGRTLESNLLGALIYFIHAIEDTNLYKRSGSFEKYREVKTLFHKLDETNMKDIHSLSDWCISQNLSFGGSADLLVVSIFLTKIKKWLF